MVQFIVTMIVLALAGIINASYLAWKHYRKKLLVCPIGGCSDVVESKWGGFLGVRNEVLGILFYSVVLIGAFLTFFDFDVRWIMILGTGFGLAFSIFLVFIQAKVIKKYCFYCLISAFLSLLVFLNSFVL